VTRPLRLVEQGHLAMPFVSITRLRVRSRPAAVAWRRSILACLGVLAALAGPPAWAQTWPSPADLRDFALAEAHETKLDARVRRHRPSPGKELSTAFIEDTLAVSQFRTIARAAKIGHAHQIRIALRASGNRNSMLHGVLVRRGGERGPRVPVSSYSTLMLGRPYPTSSPSGRLRRGRRGDGLTQSQQRDQLP
jgi:hypothetical protein